MGEVCLQEKRKQPAGLVSDHTALAYLTGDAAAQLRLTLRLRAGRSRGGHVVPFDRMPHAAGAAGEGVEG